MALFADGVALLFYEMITLGSEFGDAVVEFGNGHAVGVEFDLHVINSFRLLMYLFYHAVGLLSSP